MMMDSKWLRKNDIVDFKWTCEKDENYRLFVKQIVAKNMKNKRNREKGNVSIVNLWNKS